MGGEVVGRCVISGTVNNNEDVIAVVVQFASLGFVPAVLDGQRMKIEYAGKDFTFLRCWSFEIQPKEFGFLRERQRIHLRGFLVGATRTIFEVRHHKDCLIWTTLR